MNSVERIVLQHIGENVSSPDVFTDDSTGMAQVRDSINDAVEEIAIVTGAYTESYLIPCRDDRSFYRLDFKGGEIAWITDAILLTHQTRLEQTDLIKLRAYNPRWMIDNGTPRAYFPIGLKYVGLWPRPSADSDIVEVRAVIVPDRYSEDTARLKVRRDLEWAAAHYAIGEYYASRGDSNSAVIHHRQYLKDLGVDIPYGPRDYIFQNSSNKEPYPKATG